MKVIPIGIAYLMFNLSIGAQTAIPQAEVASAVVIAFAAPPYPHTAKENRMMGTTISEITVGPDGSVKSVRTIQAHKVFEDAVTSALKKWRFRPSNEEYRLEVRVQFEFDAGIGCASQSETLVSAELPNVVRVKTAMPCIVVRNSAKKTK